MSLQQGANRAVEHDRLTVWLTWTPLPGVETDSSAYLLTGAGRVRSDADMVFFNQASAADGAVRLTEGSSDGRAQYDVEVTALPESVVRVVFCLSMGGASPVGSTVAGLAPASISVGPQLGSAAMAYVPHLAGAHEDALILGELYRRDQQWKFRAVGQGFAGGLARLARSFGIDVEG